jgi:hypothetical protein
VAGRVKMPVDRRSSRMICREKRREEKRREEKRREEKGLTARLCLNTSFGAAAFNLLQDLQLMRRISSCTDGCVASQMLAITKMRHLLHRNMWNLG